MTLTPDDANGLSWDEYISPFEAAERLHTISFQLEKHGLAPERAEELRLMSQRFYRHLNGLDTFIARLQDVKRAFQC